MDKIDKDKVELACDESGCALIPDDGNPHNDIDVDTASGSGHGDLHAHGDLVHSHEGGSYHHNHRLHNNQEIA